MFAEILKIIATNLKANNIINNKICQTFSSFETYFRVSGEEKKRYPFPV